MDLYAFDKMATDVFGKVYCVIAKQAIERTGIKEGICVDIGSGAGHLEIAVAQVSEMKVYLLDKIKDSEDIANGKIQKLELVEQVKSIIGDVHDIPLEDESIDLVVSRASYPSWEHKIKALKEIKRILKKGGKAYIGGGYGNKKLAERIENEMLRRKEKGWIKGKNKNLTEEKKLEIIQTLKAAEIHMYEIINDESGYWIMLSK